MTKRTKWIYLIGLTVMIVIGVSAVLIGLLAAGLLDTKKPVLTISTESAEFSYDGEAHTNSQWTLVGGTLSAGRSLTVEVTGSRTDVGSSDNTCVARVLTDAGIDVTADYELSYQFGTLSVLPRPVTVSTLSSTKVYDGEPLTCPEWEITSESGLLPQHSMQSVVMPAERTEVGASENYISEVLVRDGERDVTANYSFTYHFGELTVTPRNLTVRSGSAEKQYDGEPLVCGDWELVSVTQQVSGHEVVVGISGVRIEIGESENTIAEVLIRDAGGKDVTNNYSVTRQAGALVVKDNASGETPGGPGGGGSGAGGLDTSGGIGGGEGSDLQEGPPAARVWSEIDGRVYLRLMSFGNYGGKDWAEADECPYLLDGAYSMLYLTGIALERSGGESAQMRIESLSRDYLLPCYPDTDPFNYTIQTSDVRYQGNTGSIYELYYFPYDYLSQGAVSPDLGSYADTELKYRQFVRQNYLQVPGSTLAYLNMVIATQGWRTGEPGLVGKVAAYVQNAASYSLNYNRLLDTESDIVVSFLRDYREGVCRHYASAATLLYRALGIPARYTIGYAGEVTAGDWSEISAANAHAWVEIYIDGMGWVQVEVTGAGPAFGGGSGSGSGGAGGGSGSDASQLRLKPADEYMKYDGIHTLVHSGTVQGLSSLLEMGYSYRAEISGSRRDAGITPCKIVSFRLFNPAGEEVTDRFEIDFSPGKLQVYVQEITISTGSQSKIYDGTALTESACRLTGGLLFGHSAELETVGSRTGVGRSVNAFRIAITDADGRDVTEIYKINADYGVLEVTPREITVMAASAQMEYNGSPLTCGGYEITCASGEALAPGHTVQVTVTGSQTSVGRSDNYVSSIVIRDADGTDVTVNYGIVLVNGVLYVTPPAQ